MFGGRAARMLFARRGLAAAAFTGAAYYHQSTVSAFWQANPGFDIKALRGDLSELIDDNMCGPILVRLAWHAAGTYDKDKKDGGNDGSMRFEPECKHGANNGLDVARELLEPLKKKYPEISYADLWCLAALVAIEDMGGPKIPFRFGRVDAQDASACTPDGRLPDASKDSSHIRDVFGRMGFTDQEAVALIGAHALGRCHKERSGYEGPWTHDPFGFSNSFFTELFGKTWKVKEGALKKQYEDQETKSLMMLPTDMELAKDPAFVVWAKKYAEDNELFMKHFSTAYQKLMELGWEGKLKGPIDY